MLVDRCATYMGAAMGLYMCGSRSPRATCGQNSRWNWGVSSNLIQVMTPVSRWCGWGRQLRLGDDASGLPQSDLPAQMEPGCLDGNWTWLQACWRSCTVCRPPSLEAALHLKALETEALTPPPEQCALRQGAPFSKPLLSPESERNTNRMHIPGFCQDEMSHHSPSTSATMLLLCIHKC